MFYIDYVTVLIDVYGVVLQHIAIGCLSQSREEIIFYTTSALLLRPLRLAMPLDV